MLRVVWSDRVTSAEVRQRTNVKDMVTVAHSLMWTWGGHVARTDQRGWAHAASMWDERICKRRTGRLNTDGQRRSRGWQEDSGHEQQKPERMEQIHTTFVKTMLQTAQIQAESGYISDASTHLPD
jgi:hypothetical protein